MIDVRVLGPLEALVDGQPVALPAGKPRALLARLALDAGRVVAADALVEALWGERPPPSAPKVLQAHVSQLRKALGADAIETRSPGYALRDAGSDLGRFETLVGETQRTGDPAARADLYRSALALWRGPALDEFRREPFAVQAAQRLAELRLSALESAIDCELELGRHEQLLPELAALVDAEPLRERARRQLMLALYRSGRQADALACYREGRRLLVARLGLEPGPALQELERAILRRDAALDRDPAAPARGSVVAAGAHLYPLLAPLARDARELIVVELAANARELAERSRRLAGLDARTACFTSTEPAADLARLAAEQHAELLVVGAALEQADALLAAAPCDVALAPRPELPFAPDGPVLVPFGGSRDEWAALELAAWLARAHGLPLRLLGAEASPEGRDASRMLAAASLALQRFAATAAEPALVAPGPEGILAERGAAIVAGLPRGPLDPTRRALVERTTVPLLLVHGSQRPGGLAPERTLTRFSWSLREA